MRTDTAVHLRIIIKLACNNSLKQAFSPRTGEKYITVSLSRSIVSLSPLQGEKIRTQLRRAEDQDEKKNINNGINMIVQ
jgi:two-component sensor histidine kinase